MRKKIIVIAAAAALAALVAASGWGPAAAKADGGPWPHASASPADGPIWPRQAGGTRDPIVVESESMPFAPGEYLYHEVVAGKLSNHLGTRWTLSGTASTTVQLHKGEYRFFARAASTGCGHVLATVDGRKLIDTDVPQGPRWTNYRGERDFEQATGRETLTVTVTLPGKWCRVYLDVFQFARDDDVLYGSTDG